MMKRTNLYLDADDYDELARIGKQLDRKPAWLIRKAIKEFIARNRKSRGKAK